jgi:glycosyltransferase involved in cell wall biosynthesis
MNIQILIATMNQTDHTILDRMNIQTDAIVGNQCDKNEIKDFAYKDQSIKWLSFKERGVGLNRNNVLMRATSDIIMFADDDMVFTDHYEEIIAEAYKKLPHADVIIFDLQYPNRPRKPITKIERLTARKCMRFGAARISAKLEPLRIHGISFNLCFGGGARFSSGEDSLFLMDCIRKGLKIYSYPVVIAKLIERKSTWFVGYNDKYFFDKGVLFSLLYPRLCKVYAIIHCMRQYRQYREYGLLCAYRQIKRGIRYRKRNL